MILNIGGGGGLPIRLIVTAPTGSAVSVTQGTTVLAANEVDGTWTFAIPSLGVWTINATIEGQSFTQDVDISKVGQYNVTLEAPIKTTLNDNDWATIKEVADQSNGANYWAVGDTKEVIINGKLSDGLTLSNYSTWVYIIGFDHNSSVEGTGIAFQGFKTAQTDGVDVALCDSGYSASSGKTSGQWFNMYNTNSNTGGWASSLMRTITIPVVIGTLSTDLTSAIKTTNIYTDNVGGSSTAASNVTATQDGLYLLAEFEVFGVRQSANAAEQNYQQQYSYYATGNSKIKHNHSSTATTINWWERSRASNPYNFCDVSVSGTGGTVYAHYSMGFAPAFKVGGAKYTPVEYISSSGTQYINTGYVPTPNTRVVIDAEVTSQTTASCSYFGERSGSGATDKTAYEIWSMGTAANVSSDFFGNRVSYTINTKQRLLIDKNKATVTINGNTVTNSAAAGTATIPAYIFASNDKGTAAYFINMKLYSCKIYENDVLMHDYIPAKDEWGNVGLWDDVDKKMLYNEGSGVLDAPGVRRIGSVGAGQTVYCEVDGVKTNLIVVHQGLPGSSYDSSCNGTWLLFEDIYSKEYWNINYNGENNSGEAIQTNDYALSSINTYLNDTLFSKLDISSIVSQVKIPYTYGAKSTTVRSGANGLSTKLFLLSAKECGLEQSTSGKVYDFNIEGATLDYFSGGASLRAKYGSSYAQWWLRTPQNRNVGAAALVQEDGTVYGNESVERTKYGVRPVFIVPSDTYVDVNGNIVVATNQINALNVGDSVFCKENDVDTEYILVHKGNPDTSMYDSSCNGAWLLRKDLHSKMNWNSSNNSAYANSTINTWLNETFFDTLNIKNIINQVKIPYCVGGGSSSIEKGDNGLSVKVFLPGCCELGWRRSYNRDFPEDGAKLDYFDMTAISSPKRVANLDGSADSWWMRSPVLSSSRDVWFVDSRGSSVAAFAYTQGPYAARPCFIVPLDTFIDSSNNIIA